MSKQRRAPWHDYSSRCIYMITLSKGAQAEFFGSLCGSSEVPLGELGSPFVKATATGKAIKETLRNLQEIEPAARLLQYALMPDHLHFLVFIEKEPRYDLGELIARFKVEVNKRAGTTGVFYKGFNDQILKTSRSLKELFNYLRTNPYRLAVRREKPEFFRRINELTIGDRKFQAYGNLHLLANPFKEQVIIHRADSAAERERKRQEWLYNAANRGVLVSPFISPAEKAIRDEADDLDGRFILITSEKPGERYKPSGRNFALCEAGRLLLIFYPTDENTLSRKTCRQMNALAAQICKDSSPLR